MKRLSLIAAAMLAAAPALAQPTVTVFGVADAALRRVDNEGRAAVNSLVSGSNSTSRLGFRGQEDLGDGLWAGFHLEHGIALDTGSPASSTMFFDRRATVSVGSRRWGELRAGRDFVPSYSNWGRFDPFSYVGVASASNFVSATPAGPIRSAFGSAANTTVRSSNAVQWLLPAGWGGLNGEFMWAAREGGGASSGQHDLRGLRLGWSDKTLDVSGAVTISRNELTAAAGSDFRDLALAGRLDLGMARVSLGARRFSHAAARQTNWLLGLWVPMGLGELRLSVNQADLSGRVGNTAVDADGARQFGLGWVQALSRRSVVYATLSRIDNRGAATYTVPGGANGLAGGGSSTGVEFGLRHAF